ncbi:MAG TPA: hypothetical protein VGM05_13120 [Planctomycetaceae bacterium]|jgi:hypothetical protein
MAPQTTPEDIDMPEEDDNLLSTGDKTFAKFPRSTCYVSSKLGSDWTVQEYLYADRLKVCAAPDIDECVLSYRYGPAIRENDSKDNPSKPDPIVYPPLGLIGMYVKVVVAGAAQDEDDLTWYGIIESDVRKVDGSTQEVFSPDNNETVPRGTQEFHAHGLIRLLELTTVMSTIVNNTPTGDAPAPQNGKWTIGHGLPFNGAARGEYDDRGNKATSADEDTDEFDFSEKPQGSNLWDAFDAATYLLTYNQPKDANGDLVCDWELDADPGALGWYDITTKTDGRSVKAILDELINRKRGVSYFVTYEEDAANNEGEGNGIATINVFTFLDSPIELAEGPIAANENLKKLDFENAFDVEAVLTNSVAQKFDRIVALGAFRTTTCTLPFAPSSNTIEPDWTTAEQQAYNDGASGDPGYSGLDNEKRYELNRKSRADLKLQHVYRRFRLAVGWPQWVQDDPSFPKYAVAPKIFDTGDGTTFDGTMQDGGQFLDSMEQGADTLPLWTRGIHLEHHLPFKDRSDYSNENIADQSFDKPSAMLDDDGEPNYEYLKPFILFPVEIDQNGFQTYEFLDKLAERIHNTESPCHWSVHCKMLDHRPAFDLTVSGAQQHVIAATDFIGAAGICEPAEDPRQNKMLFGLDYLDFSMTCTLRLQDRVQISRRATNEDGGSDTPVAGQVERVLYIQVPDARLDYVVPFTIVALQNGRPVQSTSGGYVRDDRARLTAIATAAAQWYGRPRQTIEITLKQIREVVKLGWLITDVGGNYSIGVNTPITGISYDLLNGRTTFQTAFADLEFQVQGE